MTLPLSVILTAVGGYVDTVGFMALQGLFPAHVTGNFVTIGAALVHGSSGVIAKLLALPVFCIVIMLTRLAMHRSLPMRRLLWVQVALLVMGAALAIPLHPFASADSPEAVLTGMTFIAAMAVQNATHRVHLASAPPSTLMTGTTTQIMLHIGDMLHGSAERSIGKAQARLMVFAVAAFAGGCAMGAILFTTTGTWAFVLPALVILLAACTDEAGASENAGQPA